MLEIIEEFLAVTGIRPETFGRLLLNDHEYVFQLRLGNEDRYIEYRDHVLDFIQNYNQLKGY